MQDGSSLRIEVVGDRRVYFAMQQNAVPLVQLVRLWNQTDAELRDLEVTLVAEPGLCAPWTARVAAIPPGATYNLTEVGLELRPERLHEVGERQRGLLRAEVHGGAAQLAAAEVPLEVLAWNEWPGTGSLPAVLAAFVQPNHPALAPVLRDAGNRLAGATGSGDLDGYQSRDPRRAVAIAQAVFDALAARSLAYINPAASFEQQGQKVRLPDQVLGDRMGTCLDLAAVYAACLEQCGLHPLLVLAEGHALAGVWCVPQTFPEAAVEDPLPLRKRAELGDILLVECTLLCQPGATFAAARQQGAGRVAADAPFLHAVDVATARRLGFRPLPARVRGGADFDAPAATPAPAPPPPEAVQPPSPPSVAPAPAPAPAAAEPDDRLARWRRRLLDLSLRNRLLNFRPGKKTVPVLATDLPTWEDALQSGRSFTLLPAPPPAAGPDPRHPQRGRQKGGDDGSASFLAEELADGRLRADLGAEELERRLLEMFRTARVSLEESGANTLFLALGFLRWFETPASEQERLAPLLLLPVELERVSVAGGYRLRLLDEDAQCNQTLVQKLRDEFGVEVAGLAELPEDEHGLDVAAVLDRFRRAVVDVARWEVLPRCWLGFFSFTKHLMWLDLRERGDDLLQSPLLRHLVESPERPFAQDGAFPAPDQLDARDPADLLCPKDADSSQLCAVLAAAAGRSFVLEGPPGTGKSQTITNLVAQCLAEGQRVLFVAEKRAALEVVQRRLDEVGLAPFCLELHSSKGHKREVVQQLGRTLEVARTREPRAWAARAAELAVARERLNQHARALHRERPMGETVFQAVAALVGLADAPRVEGLRTEVDREGRQKMERAAAALADTAAWLGVPGQHVWRGAGIAEWHPALPRELEPLVAELSAAVDAAADAVAGAAPPLGVEALAGSSGASRTQLAELDELCDLLLEGPVPEALVRGDDLPARREAIERWIAAGRRHRELLAELAGRFRPELLDVDLAAVRLRYERWGDTIWILRVFGLRKAKAVLRPVAVGGRVPGPAQVLADLELASAARGEAARLQAAAADARAWLGPRWRGVESDWDELAALVARAARLRQLAARLGGAAGADALLTRWLEVAAQAADGGAGATTPLAALRRGYRALVSALRTLGGRLQLDEAAALQPADAPGFLHHLAARAAEWAASLPALREWTSWVRTAADARAVGLGPLVDAVTDGGVPADRATAAFARSFREAWLLQLMRAEPELARFRGLDHERQIAAFRALDEEAIRLAAEVVQARLSAQLPALKDTGVESSELGILLRELKKQRRHLPVRQLFARIPHLLARLSPCLLMSPLSVAQYLGRRFPGFDVVVFDEASQIPVWDAVGAIGRGRSAVVVGDSRQLPPTSFFHKLDGADEVVDEESLEELESVLDECSAAGLHRMYLRWHYRSRHESLIAFSNHHYYDNRLYTFPAAARDGLGVRLVPVDGVYDRGRSQQNRAEAEALVAEVVRRLRDPELSRRSLGVVTFSMAQQTLVEDLLDQARREHPEIERHFVAADEPVFVKNLENVQGDERDVMLFSICYGPDQAGKVFMNFGPLNRIGGERRLNVAVTRSRCELLVFSSLRAEQIDLARTQSVGARHLRAFLDYAERGIAAIAEAVALDPQADYESPLERAVGDALVARGHAVHRQVGCSGYRIDLAVVDPRAPGRYLLGIECDGRSYHSAATARDRDRLRQAVLERLGWRLCRVWSTDFWQDAAAELARLERAIADRLCEPVRAPEPPPPAVPAPRLAGTGAAGADALPPSTAAAAPPAPADPTPASEPAPDADGPRPYVAARLQPAGDGEQFHLTSAGRKLAAQLAEVLQKEAPVCFDLVVRRLSEAWQIGRATERVRERVREVVAAAAVPTTADGTVLWATGQDPAAFRGFRTSTGEVARDATELPPIEVANALAFVLRQHVALGTDDLLREGARQFGISRLGSIVRSAMERGLAVLVERGGAVQDGDRVRLE